MAYLRDCEVTEDMETNEIATKLDAPDCAPSEHSRYCHGTLLVAQDNARNLSVYCYGCRREWQAGIASTDNRSEAAIIKLAERLYWKGVRNE